MKGKFIIYGFPLSGAMDRWETLVFVVFDFHEGSRRRPSRNCDSTPARLLSAWRCHLSEHMISARDLQTVERETWGETGQAA